MMNLPRSRQDSSRLNDAIAVRDKLLKAFEVGGGGG